MRNILKTLQYILIKTDDVSSTDLSTEDQISEINNISSESEDTKKALGESLQNIKMKYVIKPYELQLKRSIPKKEELNSITKVAQVKGEIKNMDEKDR